MIEIQIDGNNFSSLEEFYLEVESKMTRNLNWETGRNLNAFNDLLRGGFGVHEYEEPIKLRWKNFRKSQIEFGYQATVKHLKSILSNCHPSNKQNILDQLALAENEKGDTLLQSITDIIKSHNHIVFIKD